MDKAYAPLTRKEMKMLGVGKFFYMQVLTADEIGARFKKWKGMEGGQKLFLVCDAKGKPVFCDASNASVLEFVKRKDVNVVSVC